MKDLQFHPAADIFPLMEDEAFDGLVEDIRARGLQERIHLYEGKVLDGRNRYKACSLADKPILTEDVDDQVHDPIAHVLSMNLHRRHLTKSQLAIVSGRAEAMYEAERKKAEERKIAAGKEHGRGQKVPETFPEPIAHGDTRDKIGQQFGISGPLVDRGRKVVKESPELTKAIEAGVMDVSTAAGLLSAGVSKDEQKRIAEEAIATGKKPKRHGGRGRGSDGRPKVKNMATTAMQFARMAIAQLECIRADDPERDKAFTKVEAWISERRIEK